MSEHESFRSGRARIGLGLAVAAVSLVAAAAMAGVGFANSSTSASQYQYGKKVTICHHTHSKKHPWVTITVNKHAWKAHLRHGDTLGACVPAPVTPSTGSGTQPPKHGHGDDHGNKNKDGNAGKDDDGASGSHGKGNGHNK